MPNVIIPASTPSILTEAIFTQMGFFVGSATNFMLETAFAIAENQVALDISAFLAPTTVTGTFTFLGYDAAYQLPVGKLISIGSVTLLEEWSNGVFRQISGTAVVIDAENGTFMIKQSVGDTSVCGGCGGSNYGISTFQMSFRSGYPAGTIAPGTTGMLALCMAADIILKMMYDEGIGVIYENLIKTQQVGRVIQTMETRFFMDTIFGPSSRGQFISRLLIPYKIKPSGAGRLGR